MLLVFPALIGFVGFGVPAFVDGFSKGRAEGRAHRAEDGLRDLVRLQGEYRAKHGRYALDLADATGPGWQMPDNGAYRVTLIPHVGGEGFCLDAGPGNVLNVLPLSIDERGTLYHDGLCPRAPAGRPGETPEEGALRVATTAYHEAIRWKSEHPDESYGSRLDFTGNALTADDVPDEYGISVGTIGLYRDGNRFCFALTPDDEASTLPVIAVNEQGRLFHDDRCLGDPYGQVDGGMVGRAR